MTTGELSIEQQGVGLVGTRPVVEGNRQGEVITKVADKWVNDARRALGRWEQMTVEGVGNLALAVAEGEVKPEVEEVMGGMRWLAANSSDKFEMLMREWGLDDQEIVVVRGIVEAMGDKDRLPVAVWTFKETMSDELEVIGGGDELLRMLVMAKPPVQSAGDSEEKWGDIYGGEMSPKPPEKKKDKGKTRAEEVKTIVARRKILVSLLALGSLACCMTLGILVLPKNSGDGGGQATVEPMYAEIWGDRQAAKGIVGGMFWEPGVAPEDPDRMAIDSFLDTYETSVLRGRAARGESMLEELERQGLFDRGTMDIDEEGLQTRLLNEGYDSGDVEALVKWSREYLQNRDNYLGALQD